MKTTKETDLVRKLAGRVAEIAREPRMAAIKKRWRDVNALRKPDRAPVWCRPMGCWSEIIPENTLVCTEPRLRNLEYQFRQILHKRDIDDDTPVEDYFAVQAVFRPEPANVWGLDIEHQVSDTKGGAWRFDPPLKREQDLDRLQMPVFTYDKKTTDEQMSRMTDLLNGIMPVKLTAGPLIDATLGTAAADLRGLEQMMLDMAVEPALMHRLMSFLRDVALSAIDQIEATGLLTPNNIGPMICSDPVGKTGEDGRLTCANLWCMANSQEFDQVSPGMWKSSAWVTRSRYLNVSVLCAMAVVKI